MKDDWKKMKITNWEELLAYVKAWEQFLIDTQNFKPEDAQKLGETYKNAFRKDITVVADQAFVDAFIPIGFQLPDNLAIIGNTSFKYATFIDNDFVLPNSVKSIGDNAFERVYFPSDFALPWGLESIGNWAFKSILLNNQMIIPSSIKSLGDHVFDSANLDAGISLPDTIKTIPAGTFANATLAADFSLPNSITAIKEYAFQGVNLAPYFAIPKSTALVDPSAFAYAFLPNGYSWMINCEILDNAQADAVVKLVDVQAFLDAFPDEVQTYNGNAKASDFVVDKTYHASDLGINEDWIPSDGATEYTILDNKKPSQLTVRMTFTINCRTASKSLKVTGFSID